MMQQATSRLMVLTYRMPHAAVFAAVPVHAVQGSRLFGL
jgi:hypothetical protein